jgi:hypothetical protein
LPSRHSRENASPLPPCAARSTASNSSPITGPSIGSPATRPQQFSHLHTQHTRARPGQQAPHNNARYPVPPRITYLAAPHTGWALVVHISGTARSARRLARKHRRQDQVLLPPRPTAPVLQGRRRVQRPGSRIIHRLAPDPYRAAGQPGTSSRPGHEGAWLTTGSGGSDLGPAVLVILAVALLGPAAAAAIWPGPCGDAIRGGAGPPVGLVPASARARA